MDKRQKQDLLSLLGEGVRFDCSMADYTTFQVGGRADALCEVNDLDSLCRLIAYVNKEQMPYLPIGRGSNILVKDDGLEGLVILLRGSLAALEGKGMDGFAIYAGAGLSLVDLLVHCRALGLRGLEFLAGIPGAVGGAVAMNAGAFGKEIGARVKKIDLINREGEVVVKDRSQLRFFYRRLDIEEGSVIAKVFFEMGLDGQKMVSERITGYLKMKKERQPLEYPSAGSVFRNPPNNYAGRLIENAGLKGKRIGGAMISTRHANFIVNTGGAKAKDILALMYLAQERVKNDTGIELRPEIQVVGR